MGEFLRIIEPFVYLKHSLKDPLDDLADRISSTCSVLVFALLLTISVGHLSFGSDFSCVYPANYHAAGWIEFASSYCYIQPFTFFEEDSSSITKPRSISYFPWIPMIFFAQAICFYLPRIFWRFVARHCELDYNSLTDHASSLKNTSDQERINGIKTHTNFMVCHMRPTRRRSIHFFLLDSPVVLLYLLKKWILFFIAAAQFCFTVFFVGERNYSWGITSFIYSMSGFGKTLYTHEEYVGRIPTSSAFPTFTYCKVPFHLDGHQEFDEVSCILTMNYLNEKLYIVAYFWTLIISLISFASAFYATIFFIFPWFRINAVKCRLEKNTLGVTAWMVDDFLNNFLHADGLLAISLMENACEKAIVEEILGELWKKSHELPKRRPATYGNKTDGDSVFVDIDPSAPLIGSSTTSSNVDPSSPI
jgi:hypothetical protein